MGNVIQRGREEDVKPEQTLFTVTAAGAFKAKVSRVKRTRSTAEQIEEILEWKFRRKGPSFSTQTGRLGTVDEVREQSSDDQENEVLKFVHRFVL